MAAVLNVSIPQIHLDGRARDADLVPPPSLLDLDMDVLQAVQAVQGLSTCQQTARARSPDDKTKTNTSLDTLPLDIVNQILSHLVHPRSRLPGLTEAQSAHDFPRETKLETKNREDLTTLPDSLRWAADIFDFHSLRHPFHVLSLTSTRLYAFVETYCAHLVRSCNMFNLPFAHYDTHGPACVYPDLSHIVYRRLWLQHAPRLCIYCHVALDCYPFPVVKRLIAACEDCFYRQTLVRRSSPAVYSTHILADRRRSRAPVPHLHPHRPGLALDPRPRPQFALGPAHRCRGHGPPSLRHACLPRRPRRPARQAMLHLRHHKVHPQVLREHKERARSEEGDHPPREEGRQPEEKGRPEVLQVQLTRLATTLRAHTASRNIDGWAEKSLAIALYGRNLSLLIFSGVGSCIFLFALHFQDTSRRWFASTRYTKTDLRVGLSARNSRPKILYYSVSPACYLIPTLDQRD